MNYDKYIDLISEEKYIEATQYKSLSIPNVLYKYYCLDDNECKNEMRLSTLESGAIYLSALNQFNDPFEGKIFVFDDDQTLPKGLLKEECEYFINQMNSHTRICCFANPDEKHQSMPMWAYYANNHRGFCVEYEITDEQKEFIYPVSYNPIRVKGNTIIGNLIIGICNMLSSGMNGLEMSGKLSAYNHLAYLSLTCKHSSWRHENEFRALVPTMFGNYFPAIPRRIFMGKDFIKKYESRLLKIASSFRNCELYKLQGVVDDKTFYLQETLIFKHT